MEERSFESVGILLRQPASNELLELGVHHSVAVGCSEVERLMLGQGGSANRLLFNFVVLWAVRKLDLGGFVERFVAASFRWVVDEVLEPVLLTRVAASAPHRGVERCFSRRELVRFKRLVLLEVVVADVVLSARVARARVAILTWNEAHAHPVARDILGPVHFVNRGAHAGRDGFDAGEGVVVYFAFCESTCSKLIHGAVRDVFVLNFDRVADASVDWLPNPRARWWPWQAHVVVLVIGLGLSPTLRHEMRFVVVVDPHNFAAHA
mmetsp:Transcript_44005/g.135843  ORF Transcript_44005/g.135843 Transcript_44005/m.135843 type:complete len:265 (-) Transcript_44005:1521-2315(-)